MILSDEKWLIKQEKFEVSSIQETIFTLSNG
jgi:hypothetical protein